MTYIYMVEKSFVAQKLQQCKNEEKYLVYNEKYDNKM